MKMLERGKLDCGMVEIVDTESLVPQDYLLREIDEAEDFNRLYEMVAPLYCEDNRNWYGMTKMETRSATV